MEEKKKEKERRKRWEAKTTQIVNEVYRLSTSTLNLIWMRF
jgi:hypothetical protein